MKNIFLGIIIGIVLLGGVEFLLPRQTVSGLGANASDGGLIAIYNATTTDLTVADGFGSALSVDSHARLITASSN